jgi:hypothetical protein
MWRLFSSQKECPVGPEMRKWVDGRFAWLEEQFGRDVPRKVNVVLPTPEFFPDPFQGQPEDVPPMLVRVCSYLGVDPARFKLFLYSEAKAPQGIGHSIRSGAAGVYIHGDGPNADGDSRASIGIESSQLSDPTRLVATLAHEVGHELLLGQKRISREEPDHEPLTDLLTVFFGLGIFGGNATIRDSGWTQGGWTGWRTNRVGYLDQRTFGYALARFAWARNETRPAWIKHVRPDVRSPLTQGLRFLESQPPGVG